MRLGDVGVIDGDESISETARAPNDIGAMVRRITEESRKTNAVCDAVRLPYIVKASNG